MLRWALVLGTAVVACNETSEPGTATGTGTATATATAAGTGTGTATATGTGTGTGTGTADAESIATYLAAVDAACDRGITSSCWYQGIVYSRGLLGQAVDRARAADYFKRGCNEELRGPGCPEVFAAKKTLTAGEREAANWWCSQGRLDACRISTDKQRHYYMCNAGDRDACRELVPPPRDAKAGEPQLPALPDGAGAAARSAAKICDGRGAFGCATLAEAYLDGSDGLAKDPDRAFSLGMRSCDATRSTIGCYAAAAAKLAAGDSSPAILLLAKQGCDRGHMRACSLIAQEMSKSSDRNTRQQALGYWLRACYLDPSQKDACAGFERAVPRAVD